MNENNVVVDTESDLGENPDLLQPLEPDSEMKEWLINYVGEKEEPENGEVNVDMILKTMAQEFPEFLLPLAEENFIRGYQQAMMDIEEGRKAWEAELAKKTAEVNG